jgi:hypothetical protein
LFHFQARLPLQKALHWPLFVYGPVQN